MENREKHIQQAVKTLQSIQTLDDFKAYEDEIMDKMEAVIKSGVDTLDDFLEKMFSMTPDEQQKMANFFQGESFPFDPRIDKEMQRLDTLPGLIEYSETFSNEMDKRIEPYMEKYSVMMNKLADNLLGGVMGAMTGMMEGVAAAFGAEEVEEAEDAYEFDYDNPDTPVMLYHLYYARTLDSLKENKDYVIEAIEEQLQSDIWDLEVLTDMSPEDLFDTDWVKIADIRKRMERLKPEMDKEFARISNLPDAAKDAAEIHNEIQDRVRAKINDLNDYLEKINTMETSKH